MLSTPLRLRGAGEFDPVGDKQRNTAGRALCHLRRYRAVATRYGKRGCTWRGTAGVAPTRIRLRRRPVT